MTRQDKTEQHNSTHDKFGLNKTEQYRARQHKTKLETHTKQTKPGKARQRKKTKQNNTRQNTIQHWTTHI